MSEQQLAEPVQTHSLPVDSSLSGTLRIALLKASANAGLGKSESSDTCTTSFSCH